MTEENPREVVIIGSGPAGYTAAIYAARALLKPVLVTGTMYGGQLMNTTDVENFPGYPRGVKGPEMMKDLHDQAAGFGTEFITTDVKSVDLSSRPFSVHLQSGKELTTKSLIIATGARARWLNVPGEGELRSNGVSTCATCDGAFFKGEKLIVVGGGDSAMEEATFLTRFATQVTIVHRSENLRASSIMVDRAKNNPKIKWRLNEKVVQWCTNHKKEFCGAQLENTQNGSRSTLECGGAFLAIGHVPTTQFLAGQVKTNLNGYIQLVENTMTSVPGVFACGDITDERYKQAITAAGSGCKAAMDCEKWLEERNGL